MTKDEMFELAELKGVAIHSRDSANYFLVTTLSVDGHERRYGVQTFSSFDDYPDDVFSVTDRDIAEAVYDADGNDEITQHVRRNEIPRVN